MYLVSMDAQELRAYIQDVIQHNDLEHEIQCVRRILIGVHKYAFFTREERAQRVKKFDTMFKALLTEKARQERAQKVSHNNRSSTQDSSTCPTDNTAGGVSIWDVLEKEVAGSGERDDRSSKEERNVHDKV